MTRFNRHVSVALAAAALAVTVTACNPPADKAKSDVKTEESAKDSGPQIAGLPTEKDKVSYMIGMQMGKSLEQVKDEVDVEVLTKAIKSSVAGEKMLMDEKQAQQIAEAFGQKMQAKQIAKMMADAKTNKEAGAKFLAENAKKPGVKTTPSGLQYQVITEGTGPKPKDSDVVRVHYKGSLLDGKTFDSSYDRGTPATFPLAGVIPGWREGLALMPVGSKYKLWIPASIGYGEAGTQGGPIGPNATLVFEVELLEIVKPEAK
ncbi:FKBP-type peptidyl-prolyl cis-trans isomerase [Lysobacter niabensis]|uniref:Peptidyl-prolyl cis-trans isomerase n=1 Tax=Agrilutibacter niabensis TaxID=380628 RepID=A0ABU1VN46_9GAMM|nr:FKBP-type peptidyl-prolyl cis-trans isomerase [Lysobacter niabensis]MDR7098760.1 FKBP-type peptidyl-prolyl cis-trans isomerase [Lysobacter niabensis]